MGIEQICEFIRAATNETCSVNDKRATDILENYDKNKDGLLERDDFIEFYR
jgi:Ca2+-binding EF-hand superfamily protein